MDILDSLLGSQETPPPAADRHWSPMQLAVFDTVREPEKNILIKARAGSGKTTTIIEAMNHASGGSLFMAFNKAIAEDIKRKLGGQGDQVVKTLNGLGHGLWWKYMRSSELNARKVTEIVKSLVGEGTEDYKEFGYALTRSVGLAKNCAFGLRSIPFHSDFTELIDNYGFDIPENRLDWAGTIAMQAFNKSRGDLSTFDFDDQLYIPLQEGWSFPFFSNTFVDEVQDLSPIQHLMLGRLADRGSRIVGVGDDHQAIYGFRGASTNSMSLLKERFKMTELPLSISYRCASSIVKEAQFYCPDIFPRPDALEGEVVFRNEQMEDGETYFTDDPLLFPNGTLVLCRNNAPMFRAILRHVRAKRPCIVLTNFLESFQGFLRSFKTTTTSELRGKLDIWLAKEKSSAEKRGFKSKLAQIQDKYETAILLSNEFSRTEEVIRLLDRLANGTSGPTFATIHKAKGLEADNVYILRPDLMPSSYASTPDARQQEANLIYVAITRAKLSLTWGVTPKERF